MNRRLSSLPMMVGTSHGLFGDYDASIAAMTGAVRQAQRGVHVEIYIRRGTTPPTPSSAPWSTRLAAE